ncbi:MAG: hypothetical protein GY716_09155 [bacterium]|nr:hypothetical protein [bacterium]
MAADERAANQLVPYLVVLLFGLAAAPWIIPKMTSPPADPAALPSG